jgi:hypothetical protein
MLATFNGTWDWTAVGTLALAVATFVSLFFARIALKKTQDQIELGQQQLAQTQREIELSRSEVEEAHRPVVVPVVGKTFIDLGAEGRVEKRPQVMRDGKLLVPVENVGPGPALNVEAWASLLDEAGQPSTGSSGRQLSARVAGIGPNANSPLLIQVHNWTGTPNFALRIEYNDVAANGWCTDALFVAGVFDVTAIHRCERTRPISRMVQPVTHT